MIEAFEISCGGSPALEYDTTLAALAVLHIVGSRLKSEGPTSEQGRAVQIGAGAAYKVRLVNCVLRASSAADYSIYAEGESTPVVFFGGCAANKGAHLIEPIGGVFFVDENIT